MTRHTERGLRSVGGGTEVLREVGTGVDEGPEPELGSGGPEEWCHGVRGCEDHTVEEVSRTPYSPGSFLPSTTRTHVEEGLLPSSLRPQSDRVETGTLKCLT